MPNWGVDVEAALSLFALLPMLSPCQTFLRRILDKLGPASRMCRRFIPKWYSG